MFISFCLSQGQDFPPTSLTLVSELANLEPALESEFSDSPFMEPITSEVKDGTAPSKKQGRFYQNTINTGRKVREVVKGTQRVKPRSAS